MNGPLDPPIHDEKRWRRQRPVMPKALYRGCRCLQPTKPPAIKRICRWSATLNQAFLVALAYSDPPL
jgi:hypothetical protein